MADNQLALGIEAPDGLKASRTCSPGLWRLLTEGDDYHGAVRIIAMNPTLKQELATSLAALERAAAPMDRARMSAELIKQALAFHIPDRSPEEWAMILDVYLEALAPLSAEMLGEAFVRWNRAELYPNEPGRHAFFPKAAELYKLAEPRRLEIAKAVYRAKRAREHVGKQPPPTPSREERASRRQQLIDAGLLDADGRVNLGPKPMPTERRAKGESPHEMAERIRALAEDEAPAAPPVDA